MAGEPEEKKDEPSSIVDEVKAVLKADKETEAEEAPAKEEIPEEEIPAEEPAEEPAEQPVEEKPKFEDSLLSRATDIGLTEDEVKTFESVPELERALGVLERKAGESKPVEEAAVEGAAEAEKEGEKESSSFEDIPDLDEDTYDADLVENWARMKDIGKRQAEVIKDLSSQVQSLQGDVSGIRTERYLDQVENHFSKLGNEYEDIFGKGRGDKLPENGKHMKARKEMLVIAQGLFETYQNSKTPVSFQEVLSRATLAMCGEQIRAVESRKIAEELTKRKGTMMPRPDSRQRGKRPPVSEEARTENAANKVRSILQKTGNLN